MLKGGIKHYKEKPSFFLIVKASFNKYATSFLFQNITISQRAQIDNTLWLLQGKQRHWVENCDSPTISLCA
jgi:hypothetical protein